MRRASASMTMAMTMAMELGCVQHSMSSHVLVLYAEGCQLCPLGQHHFQ